MTQTLRVDLVDRLTVTELDIASRILREDLVHAITAPTSGRWRGIAVLAYMTAKKNGDPTAKLDHFMAMESTELIEALARLAGDAGALDELEQATSDLERITQAAEAEAEGLGAHAEKVEDPSSSVSANESAGGEVEDPEPNPTRPTSASSSRGRGAPTRNKSRR